VLLRGFHRKVDFSEWERVGSLPTRALRPAGPRKRHTGCCSDLTQPNTARLERTLSAMTDARFSDELRAAVEDIWEAQHEHPVVRGIGDGSLAVARFARYVRQDYLFLIEYARLLALGAARAPDLDTLRRFADLAQAIVGEEMALHRAFAAELGIAETELEAEQPARQTRAYTDFLLRVAATGDFAELAAALLPCMWGYAEIGQRLAKRGPPLDERYARWVQTYASDEFAAQADWCRALVDRLASELGEFGRRRMLDAFVTCSRYELEF